eukprot:GHVS01000510.1.p1 GENE.GHVS01000510.1~~GHVS01000510.1.p1  ORF type:complete len:328 (-),score=30.23 GHVS01000510.1:94-1077(-)
MVEKQSPDKAERALPVHILSGSVNGSSLLCYLVRPLRLTLCLTILPSFLRLQLHRRLRLTLHQLWRERQPAGDTWDEGVTQRFWRVSWLLKTAKNALGMDREERAVDYGTRLRRGSRSRGSLGHGDGAGRQFPSSIKVNRKQQEEPTTVRFAVPHQTGPLLRPFAPHPPHVQRSTAASFPSRTRLRRAAVASLRILAASGEEGHKAAMQCVERLYGTKRDDDEEHECTFHPAIHHAQHAITKDYVNQPWWLRLHNTRQLPPPGTLPITMELPTNFADNPNEQTRRGGYEANPREGVASQKMWNGSALSLLRSYLGEDTMAPEWLDLG